MQFEIKDETEETETSVAVSPGTCCCIDACWEP